MIETVKLNVGGQLHQVSRSLLDMYPNTMLFKLVSERWSIISVDDEECKSNNSDDTIQTSSQTDKSVSNTHTNIHGDAIFIDRDGQLFRHVLNYLRDGKVVLPIAIHMNTFLHELSFYGIHLTDDDYSTVTVNTQANAQSVLQINHLIESLEKEENCIRFARLCIIEFKEKGINLSSTTKDHFQEFVFTVRSNDYGEGVNKKDESFYHAVEQVASGAEDMKERSNVYLKRFGLSLIRIDANEVFRQGTKFNIVLDIL